MPAPNQVYNPTNGWLPRRGDADGRTEVSLTDPSGNALPKIDDAAFTPGTSSVMPIGAFADDVAPDSVNEGDIGALRMTLSRILKVALMGKGTAEGDTPVDVDADGHLQVDAISSIRGYTTKAVVIANGQSLSAEVDLEGYPLMGIQMPAAWDAANLTFTAATASGGTFQSVYDDQTNEVLVYAAASRAIGVDTVAGALAPWRFIKIRSGTTASAVAQTAERTITLVLKG